MTTDDCKIEPLDASCCLDGEVVTPENVGKGKERVGGGLSAKNQSTNSQQK